MTLDSGGVPLIFQGTPPYKRRRLDNANLISCAKKIMCFPPLCSPVPLLKRVLIKQCLFISNPTALVQTTPFCMNLASVEKSRLEFLSAQKILLSPVRQTGYKQNVSLCKMSPKLIPTQNGLMSLKCNTPLSPLSGTAMPSLVQNKSLVLASGKKPALHNTLGWPRFPSGKHIKALDQVINVNTIPQAGDFVSYAINPVPRAPRYVQPVFLTCKAPRRSRVRPPPDTETSVPETETPVPPVYPQFPDWRLADTVTGLPDTEPPPPGRVVPLTRYNPKASPLLSNTLARCAEQWKRCNPNQWVFRTVTRGYRLQFSKIPSLSSKVIYTRARGLKADALREEISSLLHKGAIVELSRDQSRLGFWSRYFLVQKKGGGLRPIMDLRALNKHLKKFKFRMLTSEALMRSVRQGDFHCSVDLRDAYQHVLIYPPHRKFLRFAFEGRLYEYTVLPFGLSLSPRVFVKVTEAAIAPLRHQGVRLANYIDDWLVSAASCSEAARHTNLVLEHLMALGFNVNFGKSMLTPSQQISFIGISLDSAIMSARLSPERVDRFLTCLHSFQLNQVVKYRDCMRLAGLMASAVQLLRLGRFHMRPFQRWTLGLRIPPLQGYRKVTVTQVCVDALIPWRDRALLTDGVSMGEVISRKVITTDASRSGWGATHEGRTARGLWTPAMLEYHINYLELMAIYLALKHFEPLLRGCHVLVRTDNTAALYYLNKQGGLSSRTLDQLAREMTLWCLPRLRSIRASHVPGLQNGGADLLSRGEPRYEDWSLHPAVMRQMVYRFGQPRVDLFASQENAKCALYFSVKGPSPLGMDAFAHRWPEGLLYAFPPLDLILPTLERVRCFNLEMLLVAPSRGVWRSLITPLLFRSPWRLPLHRDLLRQAGNEIFHPDPQGLDLWVWPVRGRTC